jgi:hypothetical protein
VKRIQHGALAALIVLAVSIPAWSADPQPATATAEGSAPAAAPGSAQGAETPAAPANPHEGIPMAPPMALPEGHPGIPTPHPMTPQEEVEAAHGTIDVTGSTKTGTTVVPDEVKGKWKAATFIVVDRERSTATEVTVPIGKRWNFPDKTLWVEVIEFLPDLRIDNKIYTSASNEPNNPAAHVVIHQGEEEVFDGWLFSQFPQVHSFTHPRFAITLKEGVPS